MQWCVSLLCQVCKENFRQNSEFFIYTSIKNHIVLKSLGLTYIGVCAVCSAEWDWAMLRVVGIVTCLPVRIVGWCHCPAVRWSVCCFGERLVCIRFPNSSFTSLYYMVFSSSNFLLGSHIHVYCSVYIVHMMILDCWCVCSVYVLCVLP
jgi:hypothetical protein